MVCYTGQPALCLTLLTPVGKAAPHPEIVIAAAANLTEAFRALGPIFERETGVHPVFSFASTAQLAQQIEYAAPFDVFAAADSHTSMNSSAKDCWSPAAARQFVNFLLHGNGRAVLARFGYQLPAP